MHNDLCRVFRGFLNQSDETEKYTAIIKPTNPNHNLAGATTKDFVCAEGFGIEVELIINMDNGERLVLQSLRQEHFEKFKALFQNPIARATYDNGLPLADAEVRKKFDMWSTRLPQGNPYSVFSIFNHEGQFIGNVNFGIGNKPGQGFLALLLSPEYLWHGYGKAVIEAMCTFYTKVLREYDPSGIFLKGEKLHEVYATVWNQPPLNSRDGKRSDNSEASEHIIVDRLGFKPQGTTVDSGIQKKAFTAQVLQLGNVLVDSFVGTTDDGVAYGLGSEQDQQNQSGMHP
jgi:RimJ/RimL family protein N-acetyltransferase